MKLLFVEYGGLRSDVGLNLVVIARIRQLCRYFDIDLASVCAKESDRQTALPEGVGYHILLKGDKRIRQTLPAFRPMRRLLKENKYDLIILEGNSCAPAVLPAAKLSGTKVIYVDHAVLDPCNKKDYFLWERRRESRVCQKIVTLTEQSRQTYLSAFSLPPGKIAVIPNITPKYEGPLCTPERKELVSILRLAPEKGPEYIVRIAAALKKRIGSFIWRVWGSGILEQPLREAIAREGLEKEVLLMGTTENAEELYGNAGALVLTSRYEGWGLVITEARSRGIPVFAFDVPFGPQALVSDGINGGLVPPFDCEKMAGRLADYLNSESLRKELISHTREGLEAFYPEAVCAQWKALLESLAEERV